MAVGTDAGHDRPTRRIRVTIRAGRRLVLGPCPDQEDRGVIHRLRCSGRMAAVARGAIVGETRDSRMLRGDCGFGMAGFRSAPEHMAVRRVGVALHAGSIGVVGPCRNGEERFVIDSVQGGGSLGMTAVTGMAVVGVAADPGVGGGGRRLLVSVTIDARKLRERVEGPVAIVAVER